MKEAASRGGLSVDRVAELLDNLALVVGVSFNDLPGFLDRGEAWPSRLPYLRLGVAALGGALGVPASVILATVGGMIGNRVGVEKDKAAPGQ